MIKQYSIAIDGHSSCGKSTLARALARAIGFVYIDSGAMYRAVSLYFLRNQIDWNDPAQVERALAKVEISFSQDPQGKNRTLLNGEDVEEEIRSMWVSEAVSPVATIPAVRRALVKQQRKLGSKVNVVMDGRDIGTVVFPDAALKIFLTAEMEERVSRRYNELVAKGKQVTIEEVRQNLKERDYIDSNRKDSPLRQAADAILLDNTNLSQPDQLAMVISLAKERIPLGERPSPVS